MKFGAWRGCKTCGYEPKTSIDRAKSLIASDHYFSHEYLEGAASGLKQGRPLIFSDEQIKTLTSSIEKQDYFALHFDFENGTIPCVKCRETFRPNPETEDIVCPICSVKC
jgi:hypothetical protein